MNLLQPCNKCAGFTYDFATDGGAVGTLNTPAFIPSGAKVRMVWFNVLATITSGGAATLRFGASTTFFSAAKAITDYPTIGKLGTVDNLNVPVAGADPTNIFGAPIVSGGQVIMVIGTAALTAGTFECYIEYTL